MRRVTFTILTAACVVLFYRTITGAEVSSPASLTTATIARSSDQEPKSLVVAQTESRQANEPGEEILERAVPLQKGPVPSASQYQPLPAAPIQPLIQAKRAEAEQARKNINQGRLSKQQLRQTLLNHPNPRIR